MELQYIFEGLNIRNSQNVQQGYIYTISDHIDKNFRVTDGDGEDLENEQIQAQSFHGSGLYIYDMTRLLDGIVEKYKLVSAVGGLSNIIDNSKFSDRFSFVQNFDSVAVIPYAHLNVIGCVGMG